MNGNNHLLLVDDEALNRDMLSRRLEHHGFRVEVAADGPSALQYIGTHRPDLVLLDIMMPGMTGVEVLQELRATYTPDQLPVIMVTALKDSDKVVEALNLGANDYITKPVDFPVAMARIHGQLARKAAESALRESEERYALAARGSNDGLWDWDLASGQVYYSERWKAILGYLDAEIGEGAGEWFARVHPEDLEKLREVLRPAQAGGSSGAFECEHRMRHRDGTYRWVRCRGAAVQDAAGWVIRMAGSMSDVTARKVFDPLTGLANRVLFMDRLEQEFTSYRANPATQFAVMFLDIDRFKLINDRSEDRHGRSDWSSDVCSSDLPGPLHGPSGTGIHQLSRQPGHAIRCDVPGYRPLQADQRQPGASGRRPVAGSHGRAPGARRAHGRFPCAARVPRLARAAGRRRVRGPVVRPARSGGSFASGATHLDGTAGTLRAGRPRHLLHREHRHRAVRRGVSVRGRNGARRRHGHVHGQGQGTLPLRSLRPNHAHAGGGTFATGERPPPRGREP